MICLPASNSLWGCCGKQVCWILLASHCRERDRRFGNFCFVADESSQLALTPTPVYDMLPMVFTPTKAATAIAIVKVTSLNRKRRRRIAETPAG